MPRHRAGILERHQEALASFNKAVALKPDYAECHNNLGIVLQDMGRPEEALASFDTAIVLKPDNAKAHNNRGAALGDLRRIDDALVSYEKAIALDPSYAGAFYNRGMAMHDLKRFDHALASYDKAVSLRPDYAEAHHNRGAVLQDMLRLDDAIGAYDQAMKLRPDRAESYANQSYCYLQMGRLEEGWPRHEWRKKLQPPVGARAFAQPLWLGREDISNRTLFVHWEQGFGDTIQFCRYGKLLKARGINVVMSVQEPLYRLLAQMSPADRGRQSGRSTGAFRLSLPDDVAAARLATTLEQFRRNAATSLRTKNCAEAGMRACRQGPSPASASPGEAARHTRTTAIDRSTSKCWRRCLLWMRIGSPCNTTADNPRPPCPRFLSLSPMPACGRISPIRQQ